ncbi:MAG: CoB--CoM heterodisulfide reductase iron-sulfur subunit B family protein [Promethearchaeia archaeon]
MAKTQEYKMFEGCTIGNRIPFIEASARKVFDILDIKTSEAPFSCCPDPVGFNAVDHTSWLAMGARNLTLAENEEKDIVSLCNGCFQTLKAVNHELMENEHEREKINKILSTVDREFKGKINVKHFLEVLYNYGLDKIKEFVKEDLSGLKVACHTGCHYNRPSEIMQTDDPMEPKKLRAVTKVTGAQPVDYEEEMLCCGAGVGNAEEEPAMQVLKNKFDSAIKAGAEAFVVICPACFQQMDTNQRNLKKMFEEEYNIPILYLTELLALSFGIKPDEIGMRYHRARTRSLLEKLELK